MALRKSYVRVANRAAIMAGRYVHAGEFKRRNRQFRIRRIRLGQLIRDIRRKIDGDPALTAAFATPLSQANRVRGKRQRGRKLQSLHAPKVEFIGKGKARAPYEFGCKVSLTKPRGGQFVLHRNPYDGNTVGPAVRRL